MMRRNSWEPSVEVKIEPISDHKFQKIIVELGELIYREICSCQLQIKADSIAYRSESGVSTERTVANDK